MSDFRQLTHLIICLKKKPVANMILNGVQKQYPRKKGTCTVLHVFLSKISRCPM